MHLQYVDKQTEDRTVECDQIQQSNPATITNNLNKLVGPNYYTQYGTI